MFSELLINVLASTILLAFGYLGGQLRERKRHRGENLDEYDKALAGKRHFRDFAATAA